jgi:glutamate-1-semialdehyde 2,1-aminomutase/spore coat polysaccharide biosynthesis protein SpsF
MDISGRPTLDWVVSAAERAPGVDEVIVATSTLPGDDPIADWAKGRKVRFFRGSETDVLSRYLEAVTDAGADIVVRLTGDCPFLDSKVIGEVIQLRKMKDAAYATNTDPPTYPDGLDVEVFTRAALEDAHREATRGTDRETVTRFMVRNRHRYPAANLVCPLPKLDRERWVLDSPQDHTFITAISHRLGLRGISHPSYLDILAILDEEPWLREPIEGLTRNERHYADLAAETGVKRTYGYSKACLDAAEKLIPLGAQTFSKSKLQFPEGAAPLFLTHGDGGYCYDVDGNDYVDLVGGLLPNILGYRDPDIDQAIRDQLSRGISFSLATTLETELAERLSFHIPSAEMARFGKNGSDVTTAAVRLARHITGRDKIMVGGYHGWHDWSLAHTEGRNSGIPTPVRDQSCTFQQRTPSEEIAACIIEPEFYSQRELQIMRRDCTARGIILIFDEIISGFRCGMGGLQKVVGVTPDLSTFGKAMANGTPISALVGKREFMSRMPEISYSGTFFGEALSIAAAIATIDKLHTLDIPRQLKRVGNYLRKEIRELLKAYNISSIQLYGEVELNRIKFDDKTIQSLFIQEMAKNGVLIIGSHNTCAAHKKPELDRVLSAWDATLKAIAGGVKLDGGIVQGKSVR